MKKKLLITAYSLDVGGIEKALVNLIKKIENKYEITLVLEKKQGIFLDEISKKVNILEYKVCNSKYIIYRKIKNKLKMLLWHKRINKKYDFSISFASYSKPGALLALKASSNNALWLHGNYYILYKKNVSEMKKFLDSVKAKKFTKLVFVSNENKNNVCNHYDELKEKSIVCNNFIDGDQINILADEECDLKRENIKTFINVGRHDEYQKRLTRIINVCERLKYDKYVFRFLFIGDGPDHEMYVNLINEKGLNDYFKILGKKKNPFPYYKISDAVVLSSEYEGYPVVFLESLIMNKPILSTKVSDYKDLENKYGLFCDFDEESLYKIMKEYLDNGFVLKEKFDYKKYNDEILLNIENIINKTSSR